MRLPSRFPPTNLAFRTYLYVQVLLSKQTPLFKRAWLDLMLLRFTIKTYHHIALGHLSSPQPTACGIFRDLVKSRSGSLYSPDRCLQPAQTKTLVRSRLSSLPPLRFFSQLLCTHILDELLATTSHERNEPFKKLSSAELATVSSSSPLRWLCPLHSLIFTIGGIGIIPTPLHRRGYLRMLR